MFNSDQSLELSLKLETNRALPAERAIAIANGIITLLRQDELLGPQTLIEIERLGRGSFWARFRIYLQDGANAITIAGALATAVAFALKGGSNDLAENVALACIESDAVTCRIESGDTKIDIQRNEMPAVGRIEALRSQRGVETPSFLTTEDGRALVTERGEPILAESPAPQKTDEAPTPPSELRGAALLRALEAGEVPTHEIHGIFTGRMVDGAHAFLNDAGVVYFIDLADTDVIVIRPNVPALVLGAVVLGARNPSHEDRKLRLLGLYYDGEAMPDVPVLPEVAKFAGSVWNPQPDPALIGDETIHLAGRFMKGEIGTSFVSMSGKRYPITNHFDRRSLPLDLPVRIAGKLRKGFPDPAIEVNEWQRLDDL